MLVRTSPSHPIQVGFVDTDKLGLPGRIRLTFAPGKKHHGMTGHWDRDLDADLARLRDEYKTDLLVSLLEEHEFTTLQIPDLRERVTQHGIEILWYPIPDGSIPASMEKFADVVNEIVRALGKGQTIVIHCMGGLGRTGLVAAGCLLATTDSTTPEVVEIVRITRPGTINGYGQEKYVEKFRRFLEQQRGETK